jgi:RNA polymerase sigma-70 factor (ECF subfamily)
MHRQMDEEPIEIIQNIAAGSKTAMRQCVQVYGDLLWSMALSQLPRVDAEEVVQDVFLEIWKKASRYQPSKGRPVTFIATIARRRIIDRVRKLGRISRNYEASEDSSQPEPSNQNETSGSSLDDERLDRIHGVFKQLKPIQQTVIETIIYKGFSQTEAATLLQIPLGTLKSHFRRGIQTLRSELYQKPS